MCGIVGAIGLKDTRKYLIDGLKTLDYRGYDSAGIALYDENEKLNIFKAAGTVEHLDSLIPEICAHVGIGHTRWATHGRPSDINSHPHTSFNSHFTIVHNGVIENFLELKEHLLSKGYHFKSDTDTEVIANLLEDNYRKIKKILPAIRLTMKQLEGSYAVAIITDYDEKNIYAMKNSSPLLVGVGENYHLLASDATPMITYTNKFIELDDQEIAKIGQEKVTLYNIELDEIDYEYVTKEPENLTKNLNGYPHFMLKEIEECETVVRRLMVNYYDQGAFNIDKNLLREINEADHIVFIGCGTSYHASLVGMRYFEHIGKSASSYIASEWAFYPKIPGKHPFFILISQSGETADLIHCLKILGQHTLHSLIITNTKGSTLERGCTYSMLLNAGLEVAVASTKAYVAQVTALAMLTNALENRHKIVRDLEECCHVINDIKTTYKDKIHDLAIKLKDKKDIFYLGRGYDYDFSLEASLKLKEISYIHSEAIAGGELKHGPIALIENGTPVIVFITDDVTAASMRGNVQEVKARGADVYVISTEQLVKEGDFIVLKDYKRF
ncbi:MAG: glutamine--fructose-6-phosphate transaminase (isomerizing), partial [Bacilli bacterium]|nr:glutamine--fructose-6-phosphate transaminase (isomerizing) [Bacilli bacterium]